jgi:predicted metalloprotease
VVADVEDFWAGHASEIGIDQFEPLDPTRIQPLGGEPVACESNEVAATEIEGNAVAFACDPEGYAVMWDPALLADLESKYGAAAPAEVLAHEYGHILDYQAGFELHGVIAEQFADCMAGVWAADASRRGEAPFDSDAALDSMVAAAAEFRDEPGDDPTSDDAHGLAFDRIRALQEGFDRGAAFCASYRDTPPALTESPFEEDEVSTGGNLSFDEGYTLIGDSILRFSAANPEPFAVQSVELSFMSRDELAEFHERLGDSATTVILATDTAAKAQSESGEDPQAEGSLLQQACWTGAFLGWVAEGQDEGLALSPGDLDEAVAAFADLTDPQAEGFLFEQVAQLRTGFTQGVAACTIPDR